MNTRRRFLAAFFAASSLALTQFRLLAAQQQRPLPPPGQPPFPDQPKDDDAKLGKSATKAMLEDNDKDIKKSVEKLYELASQLKAQVEKTNSAEVLSLDLVRKAEEIEKLAKDIKTRAKG
jgi:hypothetical protein